MNTRYTTVNLDVSQQGSIPSITLSQYDLGVGLGFYIMDGGLPYSEFAETDTVVLSGTKPSGVGFTVPAYYKSGNLCSFRTPQAMTTEAGTVTCEITITKVNNISVSTANFFVEVEASAHAHETVDEDIEDFSLIANQVGEYKAVAVRAAQQAAQSATDAAASASSAEESMEAAQSAASSAIAAKDDIQEYIDDSEAWARGTRGGTEVPSTDETYENNAKYYAEQSSQASMDAGVSAQEAAASVVGAVKYTAQTLTTEQKAQARTNIGAASPSDIPSGTVRYDTSQSLTDAQKTQAKNNIGVPSIDATLAVTGAAADAKKVGDEIAGIKGDLSECVRFDEEQIKTQQEKEQALANIGFLPGHEEITPSATYQNKAINSGLGTVDGSDYMYSEYALTPGEKYYISGYTWYAYAYVTYYFVNANNVVISAQQAPTGSSGPTINEEITVPTGTVKTYVNGNKSVYAPKVTKRQSGSISNNFVRYDEAQTKTDAEKAVARSNLGITDSGRLILVSIEPSVVHDGKALQNNGTETSGLNYLYSEFAIEPNKKYYITGNYFGESWPLYVIKDSNGNILITEHGTAPGEVLQRAIITPNNSSTIIINGAKYNSGIPNVQYADSDISISDYKEYNEKRRYLFIGDSYGDGYSHDGNNDGWIAYCAEYMRLDEEDYVSQHYGGAKFYWSGDGNGYFTENCFARLLGIVNIKPFDYFTDIVICGGFNDNSFAESDILDKIRRTVNLARNRYPYARVHIGCIGWIKQGNGDGALSNWETVRSNIINKVIPTYKRCVEYGASYITDVECALNDSLMTNSDGYHPGEAGNRAIARAVANALLGHEAPALTIRYDRYQGLTDAQKSQARTNVGITASMFDLLNRFTVDENGYVKLSSS